MVFYPDDTGLNLVGHLFHMTLKNSDFQSPTNPLPFHDDVSMHFDYTTGIGTWTSRVPRRYFEFGWPFRQNIFPSTAFTDTLRILDVPQGDYSAATFRPLLERLLNEQRAKFEAELAKTKSMAQQLAARQERQWVGANALLRKGADDFHSEHTYYYCTHPACSPQHAPTRSPFYIAAPPLVAHISWASAARRWQRSIA